MSPQLPDPEESAEDVYRRAATNLAPLIRFTQAEQYTDRGGTDIELEHDAWYAIESLLRTTREDVNRLKHELEVSAYTATLAEFERRRAVKAAAFTPVTAAHQPVRTVPEKRRGGAR